MVSDFGAWLWCLIKPSIMLWKHTRFCLLLDKRCRILSPRKEFMELSAEFYGCEQQATAQCPKQKVLTLQHSERCRERTCSPVTSTTAKTPLMWLWKGHQRCQGKELVVRVGSAGFVGDVWEQPGPRRAGQQRSLSVPSSRDRALGKGGHNQQMPLSEGNRALDVEHPRVNLCVSNAFHLTKQKTYAGTY